MRESPSLRIYLRMVQPLLDTREVQSMGQWNHHFGVTTYEHSLFVSYVAFRLARRLGLDPYAAARAGLLHDLYLYSPYRKDAHPGSQCFYHPIAALENAKALVPDLTEEEQNSILSHMWPLAYHVCGPWPTTPPGAPWRWSSAWPTSSAPPWRSARSTT